MKPYRKTLKGIPTLIPASHDQSLHYEALHLCALSPLSDRSPALLVIQTCSTVCHSQLESDIIAVEEKVSIYQIGTTRLIVQIINSYKFRE